MAKVNERGAGRKRALNAEKIAQIAKRHEAGETLTALAAEYGISRQTLSGYLNRREEEQEQICRTIGKWAELNRRFRDVNVEEYTMRMDFMCGDECCTEILVDFARQRIAVENRTDDLIHRAFGIKAKPTWEDFEEFGDSYDPLAIVERTKGRMAEDMQWIAITYFDAAAR